MLLNSLCNFSLGRFGFLKQGCTKVTLELNLKRWVGLQLILPYMLSGQGFQAEERNRTSFFGMTKVAASR